MEKGVYFVFEIPGIVLAQFATIAGLATRLLKASLDEISPRFEAVARSLGSSAWQAFYQVTLPLALKGLIASVILSWAKAVGEFGATTSLSYARPDTTGMNTSTGPTETWVYRYAGSAPSQGSYCGNGLVETGESCDLGSFNGQATCPYGTPSCATCLNNCQTPGTGIGPYCGDGTIQSGDGEQCDPPGGSNFGGVTCQSLGFAGGSLVCSASCLRDTTNCGAPSAPPDPTNLHRTDKKP